MVVSFNDAVDWFWRFTRPECKRDSPYEKMRMRRSSISIYIPLYRNKSMEAVLQKRLQTGVDRMERLIKAVAEIGGLAARLDGPANAERVAFLQRTGGGLGITAAHGVCC